LPTNLQMILAAKLFLIFSEAEKRPEIAIPKKSG
jgi:hypothetical protein